MGNIVVVRRGPPRSKQDSAGLKDGEEVIRGSGVILLGKLGKVSKSVFHVLAARLVGVEMYGLYILGWTLIELAGRFGLVGMDRAVVQFVSRDEGETGRAHRTIGQALALGGMASLVVTILVWLAAPWVAGSVFRKPELCPILRILALTIPLMAFSSILLAGTRAYRVMRYDVYVRSIAEPLVLLAAAAGLCGLGSSLLGIAFAYLIAAGCGAGLAVYFFRRMFFLRRCFAGMAKSPLRSPLVRFSAPIPFDDALYNLMSRLGLFVLGAFLPSASVGIYAASSETAGVLRNVRQGVDPIFTPVATALIHQRKQARLSDLFSSVCRWVLILELAFLIGIWFLGRPILSIFGTGFQEGFWCLILLSGGFAVNGALGPAEMLLLGAGRTGLNLLNTVSLLAVNLGLSLFLAPRFGIVGAAVATATSLVLINVLRVWQVRSILGVHPFSRSLLKPFLAAGASFAAGAGMGGFWGGAFPYLSALALPLYVGLLAVLGLEPEDRALILKFRRRGGGDPDDVPGESHGHAEAAD